MNIFLNLNKTKFMRGFGPRTDPLFATSDLEGGAMSIV